MDKSVDRAVGVGMASRLIKTIEYSESKPIPLHATGNSTVVGVASSNPYKGACSLVARRSDLQRRIFHICWI